MSKSMEAAKAILNEATQLGWEVWVERNVLKIAKRISSRDEFCQADSEYYSILSLLPSVGPGSIWGTDGGGVGAISAMEKGVFRMNKSGGSKRVLSALAKLV